MHVKLKLYLKGGRPSLCCPVQSNLYEATEVEWKLRVHSTKEHFYCGYVKFKPSDLVENTSTPDVVHSLI